MRQSTGRHRRTRTLSIAATLAVAVAAGAGGRLTARDDLPRHGLDHHRLGDELVAPSGGMRVGHAAQPVRALTGLPPGVWYDGSLDDSEEGVSV